MRRWFCLVAIVAMLAGCGGEGGETSDEPVVQVAVASSEGETSSPDVSISVGVSRQVASAVDGDGADAGAGADDPPGPLGVLLRFMTSFGAFVGDTGYSEEDDLDEDGVVGVHDFAMASRALAGLDPDPIGGGGPPPPGPPPPYQAARPFSNSQDCKFCHPRQFNEWRSSPHAYSGISPTFYSLVAAGQNSFGAGVLRENTGTSVGGGVGNFCLPCHAPLGFLGLEGRYGGNNAGFAAVQPQFPLVCAPGAPLNPLQPCTAQNSLADCGAAGMCTQFEGRTCVNMPPVNANQDFPRSMVHCTSDADCAGGVNGCPSGQDCGPCIIAPATIYYNEEAQEGINCEVCHNVEPNHQRSCQLFRQSDSVGVFSFDLEERETADGRRLRLGPYPVDSPGVGVAPLAEQGRVEDTLPLVDNAFHESARVDTPLVIAHNLTDRADPDNPAPLNFPVVRPTAVTCEELPYCGPGAPLAQGLQGGICQGGPFIGLRPCNVSGTPNDRICGGCGFDGTALTCGVGGPRAGQACETSVDCALASNPAQNLLERGIDNPGDETVTPLTRATSTDGVLDRPDGNYFRSSMMCAACHDVRPPFVNAVLRSCQEQPTHVCSIDSDCLNLNVGCSGNDCGPCVAENANSAQIPTAPHGATPAPVDMGNGGYRRVENLFTEWQISLYNHPDLTFCRGNSFRACTNNAECMVSGFDEGPCDLTSPYGKVITCQDCHTSNFPLTPLIDGPPGVGTPVDKNTLYPQAKAALEGSQSNTSVELPVRRVSTHFMAGVDLPLVKYPGQRIQEVRRQQLIDSGFKITLDTTPAQAAAGQQFEVHVTVENVGVGHRFPSGFSHERQNWLQVFVQEESALIARGLDPLEDPFAFDPNDPAGSAPCHLQRTIATSAEDTRDPVGAAALEAAGCIFRSGFQLDKAHPETGEMVPDGNLNDEDPEDFFVVAGTRVRGMPGQARIEVRPGAEGSALNVQYICAEATADTYLASITAGSGIDMGTDPSFPFQVRFCDPSLTPASGPGHTAPGFGNPDCMDPGGVDEGPCVPEIELSDGNERGRCAHDISRGTCQEDADCGPAGPCLFRCSGFPELECCDSSIPGSQCETFYSDLGLNECEVESQACQGGTNDREPCLVNSDCSGGACVEVPICVGGTRSGLACDPAAPDQNAECPLSGNCGNVGPCNVENSGIVNFQNQFRTTANGVCVDPNDPRTAAPERRPIPLANPITGLPSACFLNLQCTLQGFNVPDTLVPGAVPAACLINGQCSADSAIPDEPCTNLTSASDCPGGACNVEFNLELNGRPSESVFIQNHPFNFNSMPPFQPFEFLYDFEVPPGIAGEDLIVSVRLFNRHFPMRFLRNLIGTQTIRPPFITENQGDASDPTQCNDARTIDIDCFERPVVTLGQAEAGGFIANPGSTVPTTTTVSVVAP